MTAFSHTAGGITSANGGARWSARHWPLALWTLFTLAMAAVAVMKPGRPITHIYRDATRDWWSGVPVYTDGIHGFLYFPSSAVLYGPMAALPLGLCDQIWRLALVLVFSTAVFRAATLMRPDDGPCTASWVLALAIPTASINILRGQWELMMLAVVMHAAIDIARDRDVRGGLLLALAVALKPLALVPALLFGALRPGVRRPLLRLSPAPRPDVGSGAHSPRRPRRPAPQPVSAQWSCRARRVP